MNGIYWDRQMPRLFEKVDVQSERFITQTIADITDDADGSVPINLGDQSIEDPVYGVDRATYQKTAPYLPTSIDVMAVGNLPNELARDASRYFGEQLIKYLLEDLVGNGSPMIDRATMLSKGELTASYSYLREYAGLS
jgi:saccharopine dehydrogenase (NAD+, L-lysine-forming)